MLEQKKNQSVKPVLQAIIANQRANLQLLESVKLVTIALKVLLHKIK